MSIANKVVVSFILREDYSKNNCEVERYWRPLFDVYHDLFVDLINEAIEQWIADNDMQKEWIYEVIFAHRVERDGGGAVHTEYFEPVYTESQPL